ncbi:unnamed protein product [Rotaria sp. Silwood1]|nr:unnamed protein product [Rotaria sp. Silwood1]
MAGGQEGLPGREDGRSSARSAAAPRPRRGGRSRWPGRAHRGRRWRAGSPRSHGRACGRTGGRPARWAAGAQPGNGSAAKRGRGRRRPGPHRCAWCSARRPARCRARPDSGGCAPSGPGFRRWRGRAAPAAAVGLRAGGGGVGGRHDAGGVRRAAVVAGAGRLDRRRPGHRPVVPDAVGAAAEAVTAREPGQQHVGAAAERRPRQQRGAGAGWPAVRPGHAPSAACAGDGLLAGRHGVGAEPAVATHPAATVLGAATSLGAGRRRGFAAALRRLGRADAELQAGFRRRDAGRLGRPGHAAARRSAAGGGPPAGRELRAQRHRLLGCPADPVHGHRAQGRPPPLPAHAGIAVRAAGSGAAAVVGGHPRAVGLADLRLVRGRVRLRPQRAVRALGCPATAGQRAGGRHRVQVLLACAGAVTFRRLRREDAPCRYDKGRGPCRVPRPGW